MMQILRRSVRERIDLYFTISSHHPVFKIFKQWIASNYCHARLIYCSVSFLLIFLPAKPATSFLSASLSSFFGCCSLALGLFGYCCTFGSCCCCFFGFCCSFPLNFISAWPCAWPCRPFASGFVLFVIVDLFLTFFCSSANSFWSKAFSFSNLWHRDSSSCIFLKRSTCMYFHFYQLVWEIVL